MNEEKNIYKEEKKGKYCLEKYEEKEEEIKKKNIKGRKR